VHTPDTFIRAPWPGMQRATAIVHASPVLGAAFTQYTLEFEPGGSVAPAAATLQRFVYVLEGTVQLGDADVGIGGYAWWPPGSVPALTSADGGRAAVIEKPYRFLPDVAVPAALIGSEPNLEAQPLLGDPDLEVRALVPSSPGFDFAVNTLTYRPGASLPLVEVHVMEHGLLFLEGGGIYRLGDCWYPVTRGDFIYMAPYCPQWFGALGKTGAKYLIYKDWNRAAS